MSIFLHTIVITTPNGVKTWDLTNLATSLRLTNMSPGGHGEAVIEYEDVDPVSVPAPGSRVVISDELGPYWVGRVEEPAVAFRPGGGRVTITCQGYGASASDQRVSTTLAWNPITGEPYPKFPQGMSLHDAFKAVTIQLCPDFGFVDGNIHVGATLAGDSQQLWGKSAQEIYNEICSLGADFGNGNVQDEPIYWHVYSGEAMNPGSGDSATYLEVRYRSTPPVPAYVIDMADCDETEFSWPLKYVANRVIVQWGDEQGNGGTVTATDSTSKSGYPNGVQIWRDHFLDGTSHISTYYEAWAVAHAVLARFARLRAVGRQIRIKYPMVVTDNNGQPVPLWRVLAGRFIQINGLSTDDDLVNGTGSQFFISETEWDEYNRELTILTEEVETLASVVGRVTPIQDMNAIVPGPVKPAIPKNDPKQLAGNVSGPNGNSGDRGPSTALPGQQNQSNPAAAEQQLCNPQIIVNGFRTAIPNNQDLGWIEISFAGYLTRASLYATKYTATSNLTPTSGQVQIWTTKRTEGPIDYDHVTVLHTLDTGGSGFAEWEPADPIELYRDSIVGFTYVGGDAEILVCALNHNRDASLIDPNADTPAPTISGVTTESVPGGGGGGVGVKLSWTTSIASTGQVQIGVNQDDEVSGVKDNILSKKHSYTFPDLAHGLTFLYRITAWSKDGSKATLGGTFTT